MTGIAMSPTWKVEITIPDTDVVEIFSKALDRFCFAAAAFEVVPDGPWRLELYCDGAPDHDNLLATVAFASQEAGIKEPIISAMPLPQVDWVAENQKSFKPIPIGRYFIYPSHHEGAIPAGKWPMKIDASTAFGTGEHGTTEGCLLALNDLAKSVVVRRPLDVGCGTGILSMAIARAWPVTVLATDIDSEAVRVTRYNLEINQLKGRVRAEVSKSFNNNIIANNGPYDLIMANILANPLRAMAKEMVANLQSGGRVILSGLLNNQECLVMNAYREQGLSLVKRYRLEGWSTLVMQAE